MNNAYFQRARVLYEQRRFNDAEKELKSALANDPGDVECNNLLVFVLADQGKNKDALEAADRTIAMAPDWSFAWYTMAYAQWIQHAKGSSDKALEAVGNAIRMEPDHTDYQYLSGEIHFSKSNWDAALAAAEEALALDAEHVGALNLRAKSLVKLNRTADANDTLDFAIHQNPENPHSHANKGWALIERDQYDEALTHFKEALRIDPNNRWAKEGLKNAIKGKNLLYRGILKYFLWISKQSEKNQWLFIVGAYILYRFVLYLSEANPALAPLTYPIIGAYIIFAFSSWIAVPLSNLFLKLHPLGKYALSTFENRASNVVGGFILGGILLGISYFATGIIPLFYLALWSLVMCIPLGGSLSQFEYNKNTRDLLIATTVIGLVGLMAIGSILLNNEGAFNLTASIFGLSILGFSFIANYIINRRN